MFILVDNALETRERFHDTAVHPVGILASIENAIQAALENTVSVKDTSFLLCTALRNYFVDAFDDVSGITKVIGITVDLLPGREVSYFTVSIICGSDFVRKPPVLELPLCIQGNIFGGVNYSAILGIGCAGAVGCRIPPGKLVILTGERIGLQAGIHANLKFLRFHGAIAAVRIKGDGVEHSCGCFILRGVDSILSSRHNLRAPSLESVAVSGIRFSAGPLIRNRRNIVVFHFRGL